MALRDWRRHGYSGPLACAGAILAVVQAVPKKRAHYLVPMYPFLALGLATSILRHAAHSTRIRRTAVTAMALGAAIVPVYFGVAAPLFENAEEPDLETARMVLAVSEPKAPIYTLADLAEPLAWVGQDCERLIVLDYGGPQLTGQLRTAPSGAYLVITEDYQEEILDRAGKPPVEQVAKVEWRRHKLNTFLKTPKPARFVKVLRLRTNPSLLPRP